MAEQTVQLQIEGMTCEGCAQGIEHGLKRNKGVRRVRVDWRTGLGEVLFDSEATSEQEILENPVFQRHYKATMLGGCC
ncbi:MAG: heavy-metal-associated domain-containing protein [Chloroflexi bacterium]|nr:heavy-metal-associated domain-containing protein [Chloroflexota bacterium]